MASDRKTTITSSQIRKHTLIRDDHSPDCFVWQAPVIDKDLTSPPASGNAEGDRYIVVSSFSWDLLNEDCANISDWNDLDAENGESTQVVFDTKSCFKLDTGEATAGNSAKLLRVLGSSSNNYSIEMNLYCDAISIYASDSLLFLYDNGIMQFHLRFFSTGLFIYDGSSWNEVGVNLVIQDQWQKWRFEVIGGVAETATVDIYLDDILKASDVDCSVVGGAAGNISFDLKGENDNDRIVYLDYIKIGTGLTDDWYGQDNKIVQYINESWSFFTPQEGWKTWVKDEDKYYNFDGSSWNAEEAHTRSHSIVDSSDHSDKVDYIDIPYSPTLLTGGVLSEGTDVGTLKVSALTALIRVDISSTDALKKITLAEQNNQVIGSADVLYYVVLDYNANVPQIVIQEAEPNNNNRIQIGRCMKESDNTVHWRNSGFRFQSGIKKTNERIRQLHEWQISKNIVIADEGSKQFSITAGSFFRGITEQIFSGFDSSQSANVFTYVYYDGDLEGGKWVYVPDQTDIDVDNYNDIATGLSLYNRYKCDWVFVHPDMGHIFVVYGQLDGTVGQISDSIVPILPDLVDVFGALVGRIIIDSGVATFERIEMISTITFNPQVVIDHNDNSNKQGGTTDEYYHLTSAEYTELNQWLDNVTLGSGGKITLPNGTDINEFSTDDTLAGDSDDAIPTEKAVKKYVDDNIGGVIKATIGITIDAQSSVIDTGYKGFIRVPFACTITKVSLLANKSGSIIIDLWKCSYSDYDGGSTHPVDGDSITASAPPTITTATKSEDNTLTAWTTSISAGEIIAFNVDSCTDIEKVTLVLEVTKI